MAQTHNGFEDKGFVVLGGTQGVGPSVILGAAKLGAKVVFGGSAESEIDVENVLADTLASNLRDRVKYVQADTTSEVDVDRFFDTALEELDEIHVLVDNLDSTPTLTSKSLAQTPLSYWNTVMTTCLRQPFLVSRRAIAEFLAQGEGGRIVYISSVANEVGASCFAAAESALHAFTRSVVKEYGSRGIACNHVALAGASNPKPMPDIHSEQISSMFSQAEDHLNDLSGGIVEIVLFLASQEASFVNGEVIHVQNPE